MASPHLPSIDVQSLKVFILTILMVGYLDFVDISKDSYQTLEFYAGAARMAKLSSHLGGPSAAMDRLYDSGDNKKQNNAMDFNTSGGFLFPDWTLINVWSFIVYNFILVQHAYFILVQPGVRPTSLSSQVGLHFDPGEPVGSVFGPFWGVLFDVGVNIPWVNTQGSLSTNGRSSWHCCVLGKQICFQEGWLENNPIL